MLTDLKSFLQHVFLFFSFYRTKDITPCVLSPPSVSNCFWAGDLGSVALRSGEHFCCRLRDLVICVHLMLSGRGKGKLRGQFFPLRQIGLKKRFFFSFDWLTCRDWHARKGWLQKFWNPVCICFHCVQNRCNPKVHCSRLKKKKRKENRKNVSQCFQLQNSCRCMLILYSGAAFSF